MATTPNISRCYAQLNLSRGASLDQIKNAYRRLAFRYHPDLNADPSAAKIFQEINEAYVILRQTLESGTEKPTNAQSRAKASQDKSKPEFTPRSERSSHLGPEDVLTNILADPFARKVFDDIYREIRRTQRKPRHRDKFSKKPRANSPHESAPPRFTQSGGLFVRVSDWIQRQLDHEQTVTLPPSHLMPGSVIRIHVELRFNKGQNTLDFKIPKDYLLGRPIRLKGLGRKWGPWQGDLYIRLRAETAGN